MHAFKTGKALLANGYGADVCYTSPSLRCVQSANGILAGMGKKNVPMQVEPGLFECYLNDFKRTLCFMTKEELAANGYNIDQTYQPLIPFMRPHDSQADYYERCRTLMDQITERHQATGGTILIVAHAPSLEGLTRHLSGGKFQPEKLFDIARRVPFLAMTIIEKNGINSPWLFRTRPLQSNPTQSMQELPFELITPSTPLGMVGNNHSLTSQGQQQMQRQQQQQQQKQNQQPSLTQANAAYVQQNQQPIQQSQQLPQQNLASIENLQLKSSIGLLPIDLKKVVKSSTAPNLRISNSLSEVFRVI
jgi:broad specificity phosphatase PhoE